MIEAELPDGTVLEFPEGTSQDVIHRVVKQRIGAVQQPAATPAQPQQRSQLAALGGAIGQGVGNVALGAQNLLGIGLEKLGAEQAGKWLQQDAASGKAKMQGEIAPYEQQYPLTVGGGRFGGEVLATLPVGGALGKAASMIPGAGGLATALRTGGMAGPNMATRIAGGAATGGTAAALLNPEEADTGAAIGAALPVAGVAAKGLAAGLRNVVGATTGVGDEALKTAYAAGRKGGATAEALRQNMRGQTSMLGVLDDAKSNLEAIRQARSAAYKQNMASVNAVAKPLDMAPIEQSVNNAVQSFTFKGQAKNPQVAQALQNVSDEVAAWRQLDPADFHTPEGLDALKQRIGAIRESLPIEARSSRAAVDGVYNSIKRQIESEAPEYAKAMRDYTQASDLIDEITRSLSLNDRATADTAMRKLQSVMRNNVNTNYGARAAAMQALEQQGGRELVPALAGQALNDWMPRGIQRATGALGAVGAGSVGGIPAAAGMAALSSPRLMGEAAYLAGTGARVGDPLIQALRSGAYRVAPVLGAQ